MRQNRFLWIKCLIACLCFVLGIGIVMFLRTGVSTRHDVVDSTPSAPQAIGFLEQKPETLVQASDPTDPYPGKTIDQVFPILFERSFNKDDGGGKEFEFDIDEYQLAFSYFSPQFLKKQNKSLLRFPVKHAKQDYHSSLVGVSSLLGRGSTQLYVIAGGPGAVCCTNYWIVDISGGRPRMIFRSEEYGSFRDAMEIFDYDADGVYELVQFDSCFRYFLEDCGACGPEPRVYFRFDKRSGKYRPAPGISEDFVREIDRGTELQLREFAASPKSSPGPEARYDRDRLVFSYFVDLLHRGETKKAWRILRKYHSEPSKEMLREIDSRLDECPFYQAISKN